MKKCIKKLYLIVYLAACNWELLVNIGFKLKVDIYFNPAIITVCSSSAQDRTTRRKVAITKLNRPFPQTVTHAKRAFRERLLMQLAKKNVSSLFGLKFKK